MSGKPLLSAQDREKIAQLQLVARRTLAGLSGGRHKSSARGTSSTFQEHRQYAPGDELRSLDWKLYGKTDRLFVRQYEDETQLRVNLLIDQSGSMGYAGTRSAGVTKHDYAIRLAACIATLCMGQQDPVGLATFDSKIDQLIPPRSQAGHLAHLFRVLAQSQTGGETQLSGVIRELARRIRRRGSLIILISDVLDDANNITSALAQLSVGGHEVIVVQVWDADEFDFPFRGRAEFHSLEQRGISHRIDPRVLRSEYRKKAQEFNDTLSRELAQSRIDLIRCSTDQDPTEVLAKYLSVRAGESRQPPQGQPASDEATR